jgi:acyl-CoA thioesterase-1
MTFSSAVSDGTRWKAWNTNPTRAARSRARWSSDITLMSSPAIQHLPVVGMSRPASSASSVDLPAPDAPTRATVSPAAISRDTSSTMVSVPSGLLTFLVSRSALRTMSRVIGALLFCLFIATSGARSSEREKTVLVFGDSLSAAYGLRADQGWVALLEKRIAGRGYRVVNASVSGETTSGGRARLARALEQHRPQLVILELGANDALRGLPIRTAAANLAAMVDAIQAADARVLLLGIEIPPNYGPAYTTQLRQMYADLARREDLPFVPFFLDGIALDERYMQADGLHPNAGGQPLILENVWRTLQPLLQR